MQKQPHGTGITGTAGLLSCCAALRPAAGGDIGVGQLGAGVHDLLVNGGLGQGGGGGLLPVDVRAVLLHEPVQLLVGNASDLVLHSFAFHGGNSFRWV